MMLLRKFKPCFVILVAFVLMSTGTVLAESTIDESITEMPPPSPPKKPKKKKKKKPAKTVLTEEKLDQVEDKLEAGPIPAVYAPEQPLVEDAVNVSSDAVNPLDEGNIQAPMTSATTENTPSSSAAAVPSSGAITLTQSMVGGYQQSPLVSAEYQVKAAQMDLVTAKKEWFPTATGQLSYNKNSQKNVTSGSPNAENGQSTNESKSGQMRIEQNLYRGGATIAGIKASEKQLDAATADYLATENSVLLRAIKAHIDCYTRQKLLELNKANESVLQKSHEITQARYELGNLTLYDVAATKAKLEKAKGDVTTAKAQLDANRAAYVKETGIISSAPLEKATYPLNLIPKTREEAISLTLQHNPELRKKDAEAEAAKANVDRVTADLLPSFTVGATANRTLTDGTTNQSSAYPTGSFSTRTNSLAGDATLSIPLDFRGSTQSSIKKYKYDAARKRLESLYQRRVILEKVNQAWDAWEAAKAKISQVKSQLEAAKVAMVMAQEEYLAGNKETLDVLSAEQDNFSAEVELLNSEQEEVKQAFSILEAIGILRALYLNLDVQIYEPLQEEKKIPFWGLGIRSDERINIMQTANDEMVQWKPEE